MHIPTDVLVWSVREGLLAMDEDARLFGVYIAADVAQVVTNEDDADDAAFSICRGMGAPYDDATTVGQAARLAFRLRNVSQN